MSYEGRERQFGEKGMEGRAKDSRQSQIYNSLYWN